MKIAAILLVTTIVILSSAGEIAAQDEDYDAYVWVPYSVVIALDVGIGIPSQPHVFSEQWNSSLPFSVSAGYAVFPWMEVLGTFTWGFWSISEIPAKAEIGVVGTEEVSGGGITTLVYGGMVKFIPLPKKRLTPFAEVGGGAFTATAKNLDVEDVLVNTMDDISGAMFQGGIGVEYAFNENWNVCTSFIWTVCLNGDFNPETLLLNIGEEAGTGGDLQYSTLKLGIKMKI